MLLNGVIICKYKLSVELAFCHNQLGNPLKLNNSLQFGSALVGNPLMEQPQSTMRKEESSSLKNLYVSGLAKGLDEFSLRRIFARFGKI